MKSVAIALSVFIVLAFSSCTKVLIRAYGIKNPKPLTEQQVLQYAHKNGLDRYNLYTLDTSYSRFLSGQYATDGMTDSMAIFNKKTYEKQLFQMIQYLLFDKDGYLITHIVNCDVGGFPTLNWNEYNSFDQFPVSTISDVDSTLSIAQLKPYYSPVTTIDTSSNYDYQCVIYFNKFMSRHSKKMLRLALENIEQERKNGTRINVHLVNNDYYFSQAEFL